MNINNNIELFYRIIKKNINNIINLCNIIIIIKININNYLFDNNKKLILIIILTYFI